MSNYEKLFVVTVDGAINIVNVLAYEHYARVKRRYMRAGITRRPSFDEFFVESSQHLDMRMLPREAWRYGYDFIADLFDFNEANGEACDEEAVLHRNIEQTFAILRNRR